MALVGVLIHPVDYEYTDVTAWTPPPKTVSLKHD